MNNVIKKRKRSKLHDGNAYLMVVIAIMAVLALVSVALIISINSRRITEKYGYYVGLYDLAVAGNEQVLHLMNDYVYSNHLLILPEADFIQAAMPFAIAGLQEYFFAYGTRYRRDWQTQVFFTIGEVSLLDEYATTTIVAIEGDDFLLHTQVWKYTNGLRGHPILVTSRLVWTQNYAKNLDYYTLEMVELMRVAD